MGRSYFFFGDVRSDSKEKGPCRVTRKPGYLVHGGNKEDHEQIVELTHEVSRAAEKEKPETKGEINLIVRDAMKKVGMKPPPINYGGKETDL